MPLRLLAFDPSLTCTGWAEFLDGVLIDCGYEAFQGSTPQRIQLYGAAFDLTPKVDHLAIEVPQIYTRDKSKGDPNGLTPLWGIAGALLATIPHDIARLIKPRDWKGQVKKRVTFSRILQRLSPVELSVYNRRAFRRGRDLRSREPPGESSRSGDALDAVGVGLYVLGRFELAKGKRL